MWKNDIIWKAYKLGDIFDRSTELALGISQKDLDLSEDKDDVNNVALISASRTRSGRVGYISINNDDRQKISINKLTFDDQWGFVYFQNDPFVITGGHNSILELKNNLLENILNNNIQCYQFLALLINKITLKSGIFGYGYKINNKLDRELIILPCLEVKSSDEYIWEENGRYFTLAVDYIKQLMDKAKELKEQKTIRFYEKEKAKYEKEKAKYEKAYLEEKKKVVWKGYALDDLFNRQTPPSTNTVAKNLTICDEPFNGSIALITRAETNNGIRGYIKKLDYETLTNSITYNDQFSFFKYHNYEFTTIKDHLSIIICKNNKMQNEIDKNEYINLFFVNILNHIYSKEIFNFNFTGADYRFDREIVLLPFFESEETTGMIEYNGKYYTLAINYISYLYLQGRCNYYQKLIDKYTYQY